ncbi:unnamed protein product [Onchocerca flexuosa]|uniref:Venom protein n=1 Tax=Onchocerca flexuosa TaxID=387005 RepID=A0A183HAW1_9BILA|nr:unnamed protein product [Onchocerca flexuosa]
MKVQVLLQTATLTIFVLNVTVSNECAEQLQRCAIITEEYERLMQERKRFAFLNCFTKQICSYELALFENCFERSVRAVRTSFNREILSSDYFIDSANRYLSALENCFDPTQESTQFPDFKPTLIDEDAIYARTIYSVEYADHLWGLPQLTPTYPYLENSATLACLIKERTGRVFGNGINRFIDSTNLKLYVILEKLLLRLEKKIKKIKFTFGKHTYCMQFRNNVNNSCLLEKNEMQCYRRHLSNDKFYQELLIDRDHIIRTCIRNIRLQTRCHSINASRLRACLCSAREEFENRIQTSILQCIQQSHTDHLHRQRQEVQRQWYEQQNKYFSKFILDTGKKQYVLEHAIFLKNERIHS